MLNIDVHPLSTMPSLAPTLADWAYNEWYQNRPLDFNTVLKAYQMRAQGTGDTRIYIAFVDSRPAGMVSLRKNDLYSRPDLTPWLSSLYVVPDLRCQGIGSYLVEYLSRAACSLGHDKLYLFLSYIGMDRLQVFYTKLGWSFLCECDDNDGNKTGIFQRILA